MFETKKEGITLLESVKTLNTINIMENISL